MIVLIPSYVLNCVFFLETAYIYLEISAIIHTKKKKKRLFHFCFKAQLKLCQVPKLQRQNTIATCWGVHYETEFFAINMESDFTVI